MLHKQTTSPQLVQVLETLLAMPELDDFRLVGGTALSLLKGHRLSVDIDLFTDTGYGTRNFSVLEEKIKKAFPIVENYEDEFPLVKAAGNNRGLQLHIGYEEDDLVKTDILFWNDPFLFEAETIEGIRMASEEEIGAMKLDVVSRGGRKKDFWDLVEIFEDYSLTHLLDVYRHKYEYNDVQDVVMRLTDFSVAEEVPDPICLRTRTWEEVKARMIKEAGQLNGSNTTV